MLPLISIERTREIEQRIFTHQSSYSLMKAAGRAVAHCAKKMSSSSSPIVAIVGKGNNGGDSLVAAELLRRDGYRVQVLQVGRDEDLRGDARLAYDDYGGEVIPINEKLWQSDALILDGLFGIGLSRAIEGEIETRLVQSMCAHSGLVLSIDVPSGLCANRGLVWDQCVVRATETITFFSAKPGLFTGAAVDYSGQVTIAPLGQRDIDSNHFLIDQMPTPERLNRRASFYKGDLGQVLLVGGEQGMMGALVMAARAAAILGAGKTYAMPLGESPALDWLRPDIMWQSPLQVDKILPNFIACGMGLGTSKAAFEILMQLISSPSCLLLDADALNLLAIYPEVKTKLQQRPSQSTILTPHSGEAARLLGVEKLPNDRIAVAKAIAQQYQSTVVLKGPGTIIALENGSYSICAAGNAGLARGGSGDILSGMIVSIWAQTEDSHYAAKAGVWLHAAAADEQLKQSNMMAVNIQNLAQTATEIAFSTQKAERVKILNESDLCI